MIGMRIAGEQEYRAPFVHEVSFYETNRTRPSAGHRQLLTHLGRVGFATIFALAGISCTSASVEDNGGTGGTGKGGLEEESRCGRNGRIQHQLYGRIDRRHD